MTYQCPKCPWAVTLGDTHDRLPPWCARCGAEFARARRIETLRPVEVQPAEEQGFTTVSGTGGRPWLKQRPAAVEAVAVRPTPAAPRSDFPTAEHPGPGWESKLIWVTLGGIGLMFLAVLAAGNTWSFARTAETVEGRVATWYRFKSGRMIIHSKDPVAPTLGVPDGTGTVIEYVVNGRGYGITTTAFEVGQTVPVMYSPDAPADGRRADTLSLYSLPLVLGLAGLLLAVGSVVVGNLIAADRAKVFGHPG